MTRSFLLMVVLACGGKQDVAPQPISNVSTNREQTREQKLLAKMGEFRDAMCKCAEGDADCAKRVSDDMQRWAETDPLMKEPAPRSEKADPAAEQIGHEMGECMQRAMMPRMGEAGVGP